MVTDQPIIMKYMFVFLLANTVRCSHDERIDPGGVVSVKVTSTGCYSIHRSNSIMINGQEYSRQLNGINIVQIRRDGTITSKSFRSEFGNLFSRLIIRNYMSTIKPGTAVIISSQNSCRISYKRWATVLLFSTNISIGTGTITTKSRTTIIFGCRGVCPQHVSGWSFPSNEFSELNDDLVRVAKFRFGGSNNSFTPDTTATTITTATTTTTATTASTGDTNYINNDSNKNIIIIILVVVILILIAIITIVLVYLKNNKKINVTCCKRVCKKEWSFVASFCKFRHVQNSVNTNKILTPVCTANTEDEIYADLNRRPSALPNIYEPLQKMSVQYEEIHECEEDNETERKKRADTNLSAISAKSLSTSQIIFHKISANETPLSTSETSDFATYVQVDDGNVIYKAPSGVPKFESPKTIPQNTHRDSYVPMQMHEYQDASGSTYPITVPQNTQSHSYTTMGVENGYQYASEESQYAPLGMDYCGGYNEEDDNYSVLLPN